MFAPWALVLIALLWAALDWNAWKLALTAEATAPAWTLYSLVTLAGYWFFTQITDRLASSRSHSSAPQASVAVESENSYERSTTDAAHEPIAKENSFPHLAEFPPVIEETLKPTFSDPEIEAIEETLGIQELEATEEIKAIEEIEATEEIEAIEETEATEEIEAAEEIEAIAEIEVAEEPVTAQFETQEVQISEATAPAPSIFDIYEVPEPADWEMGMEEPPDLADLPSEYLNPFAVEEDRAPEPEPTPEPEPEPRSEPKKKILREVVPAIELNAAASLQQDESTETQTQTYTGLPESPSRQSGALLFGVRWRYREDSPYSQLLWCESPDSGKALSFVQKRSQDGSFEVVFFEDKKREIARVPGNKRDIFRSAFKQIKAIGAQE